MDELEFDGRKYISARRAAKEHGYSPDYIGQLIRAGKLIGKKVGRGWFVEFASFEAYLQGGMSRENATAGSLSMPTARSGSLPAVPHKVPEQPVSVKLTVQYPPLLRYVSDHEPSLPSFSEKNAATEGQFAKTNHTAPAVSLSMSSRPYGGVLNAATEGQFAKIKHSRIEDFPVAPKRHSWSGPILTLGTLLVLLVGLGSVVLAEQTLVYDAATGTASSSISIDIAGFLPR